MLGLMVSLCSPAEITKTESLFHDTPLSAPRCSVKIVPMFSMIPGSHHRETVTRTLGQFRKEGTLSISDSVVTLHDPEKLHSYF